MQSLDVLYCGLLDVLDDIDAASVMDVIDVYIYLPQSFMH